MNENPYSSPSNVVYEATREDVHHAGKQSSHRPLGISILAVLHMVIGGLAVFGQVYFVVAVNASPQASNAITIGPALLFASQMVMSVIMLASAIGMWTGAKWGWWLGAFNYVHSVFQGIVAMLTVGLLTGGLETVTRNPEYSLVRQSLRMGVCALITVYFFQGNVLEYFGHKELGKLKAFGILVGISLVLAVAVIQVSMVRS